ncbi:uncharacterized protein MONBRDRAFT_6842 [Monosiga brevicollis MX1]|uniref:Uncharacterized protein n=1 Tax=Monosiga brevicollis TaxID=81824 RepID=A9UUE7_MONBE|nr:uncharacterized protein MONBRDRAFT_6842 [Monosiga brevicollis MX1]EDQ90889.1 predicted protein [Monosiga brevicollis MX1]|eukprot:XP_001744186.1 hypothetical protein [Monosiga brevicollis MX1]
MMVNLSDLSHLSQRGWAQVFVTLAAAAISIFYFSFSPFEVAAGICASIAAAGAVPLLFDAVHYLIAFCISAPDARPPLRTVWTKTRLQRWSGLSILTFIVLACGLYFASPSPMSASNLFAVFALSLCNSVFSAMVAPRCGRLEVVDLATHPNTVLFRDFGAASAMSYWHGYLQHIAGDRAALEERFRDSDVGGMRVPRKLYILVPQDCEVNASDNKYEGLKATEHYISPKPITIGGVVDREMGKHTLYTPSESAETASVAFAMELASPLNTMKNALKDAAEGLLELQSEAFYLTLRGILKQEGVLDQGNDEGMIKLVWGKNRSEVLKKMRAEDQYAMP